MSEGRKDLSIIATKYSFGYMFEVKSGFINRDSITSASLIEQINSTGWGHLFVQSSSDYSDDLQAYMAGVIEGIISRPLIEAHWSNTYEGFCSESNTFCTELLKYLKENFLSIVKKSRNIGGFLKMIRLKLWHIKGLQDGYDGNWKRNSSEIDESYLLSMQDQLFNLYLLQADGDMRELSIIIGNESYYKNFLPSSKVDNGRCSALIKYINGSIYTAHVTWNFYNTMLRLTKLYDFPYRIDYEKSSPIVPGRKLSFSSYPGILGSVDDFYVTSAGLVTLETTICINNMSLYEPLKNMASEIVLEYSRADAANRLATSGSEWADIFSRNNSGTYSNQWMIVNYNLMKDHHSGDRIPDGTLYIIEQIPGLMITEDVTDHLRNETYWASYNLPYNNNIWDVGVFNATSRRNCRRAQMFQRNQTDVIDENSLMRVMRYNDFKNDPLAKINCTTPYSATYGLSSRNDLDPQSGECGGYSLHGGIDLKFTNLERMKQMKFVAICGPTYDQQPVFDWSNVKGTSTKHNMQPQKFEFSPLLTPFT